MARRVAPFILVIATRGALGWNLAGPSQFLRVGPSYHFQAAASPAAASKTGRLTAMPNSRPLRGKVTTPQMLSPKQEIQQNQPLEKSSDVNYHEHPPSTRQDELSTITGTSIRELMSGFFASLLISCAVVSIAVVSPFVKDGEAVVARLIPPRLSHYLRDRWQSWAVFNGWTWALVAPGLAISRPDLLRKLLNTHNQHLNVPYCSSSEAAVPAAGKRVLDIYHHGLESDTNESTSAAPKSAASTAAPRPVLVFVHGGAWSHGSKDLFRILGKQVRDAGYVCVVVGYRRYPLAPTVWHSGMRSSRPSAAFIARVILKISMRLLKKSIFT